MASFVTGLWESVFQPGTSPQLILATHLSFTALLITLAWLIFVTHGNIHFIMLFIIATLLWITVIWFINELKSAQLLSNQQLEINEENENKNENKESIKEDKASTTATEKKSSTTKSRKA
ncbi:similar to Saccharomyces cerevisiae YMR123W PKR1 V-ATPase assembly factor [Maudiozyma saulgeensis]|uniref:Similar to Saccharomyces cerevisiae YMR123W PKR1 V-ATPase assembly factor n=1 Tax=Maudiozyma saulgeensis TaxID=1789683 RepID=A0A1X7R0K9_9SACH|nr:similar to Saccharomyces cerevisiae YMR123W PKR1 V-ATPase assembly factor [Kazachstania saulgeensis]